MKHPFFTKKCDVSPTDVFCLGNRRGPCRILATSTAGAAHELKNGRFATSEKTHSGMNFPVGRNVKFMKKMDILLRSDEKSQ
jgi:hypothetical protein